jgi:hypothetical protein
MGKRLYTEFDVRRALGRACVNPDRLAHIARVAHTTGERLTEVCEGKRSPSPSLCEALGFAPVTRYLRVRKGRAA